MVFISQSTLNYFIDINGLNIWKFISTNIDTAISTQPIGDVAVDTVNGPLWTIRHEVNAYIFLGVLGIFGLLRSTKNCFQREMILAITLVITGTRIFYTYNQDFSGAYGSWFGDERFLLFLAVFMWGVTINLYKDILVPLGLEPLPAPRY